MKLPVKMTSGSVNVSGIRLLLYGPPKIGKAALASGFPDSIFAATEKGYKALKVYKKDIETWEDFVDFVDTVVAKEHMFKTVIVDTADQLFDKCSMAVCEDLGVEHESEAEWGRGWSEVKKVFTRVINKLLQSDLGVIFISHTKGDKITTQVQDITKTVPTLSNQARRILLPLVDTIGCMQYKNYRSKKDPTEFIERLVINFKPSEYVEAGDRTGLLPPQLKLISIPEDTRRTPEVVEEYAKKNYEIFASYYSKGGEKEKVEKAEAPVKKQKKK